MLSVLKSCSSRPIQAIYTDRSTAEPPADHPRQVVPTVDLDGEGAAAVALAGVLPPARHARAHHRAAYTGRAVAALGRCRR